MIPISQHCLPSKVGEKITPQYIRAAKVHSTQGKCNIDAPDPTCNHCSVRTTNRSCKLATEIWNKTISAVKIHAIARANHMNKTLTLRCTTVIELRITIYAVSLPWEKRLQDVLRALCDQSITRKTDAMPLERNCRPCKQV